MLFVESDRNLHSAIGRLLATGRPDIDAVFVADGDQAVAAIRSLHAEERHLDVLVTDYAHPPGPDGAELVRWIRALPDDFTMGGGTKINRLPVVVQSGNRFADNAKQVDPDVIVVRKPYKFDTLVAAMDAAVRASRERNLAGDP